MCVFHRKPSCSTGKPFFWWLVSSRIVENCRLMCHRSEKKLSKKSKCLTPKPRASPTLPVAKARDARAKGWPACPMTWPKIFYRKSLLLIVYCNSIFVPLLSIVHIHTFFIFCSDMICRSRFRSCKLVASMAWSPAMQWSLGLVQSSRLPDLYRGMDVGSLDVGRCQKALVFG